MDSNTMFGPFSASIRNHLGEFADEWMKAKIKLVQKLGDQIAGENDKTKLVSLRCDLHEALISEGDVDQMDAQIGAFLAMIRIHSVAFREIQKAWKETSAG